LSPLTENINNHFFDGHYKDIWRSIIPEGLTKAEVDYIIHEAELKPGSKVLDLMCGYGRHTLALSREGICVTAVDNLRDYVKEIEEIILKENLPVSILQQDVMQFRSLEKYDLVI
jgi:cyclopropane fatty-acyl-phospholipid synthase-like methyltransferase